MALGSRLVQIGVNTTTEIRQIYLWFELSKDFWRDSLVKRRRATTCAAALLLAALLSVAGGVGRAAAQEVELPPSLPNGIAAGDVTPTSVVLWARSTALGPVDFTIESSRTDPVTSSVSAIKASRPVTVVVDGLRPGTTYSYTAITSAGDRMNGEFKTPALDGHRTLRFGISGDGRGDWLPFQALANAPDRNLDFFVYLGDTVYADIPSPAVAGRGLFTRRVSPEARGSPFDASGPQYVSRASLVHSDFRHD